jgi:hypothetical protein
VRTGTRQAYEKAAEEHAAVVFSLLVLSRACGTLSHVHAGRILRRRWMRGQNSAALVAASSGRVAPHRQLPGIGSLIVANEVPIAICASQFEIAMIG